MHLNRKTIPLQDLIKVASATSFRGPEEPPFRIGDVVRPNCDGPSMVVVDTEGDKVTVAWRDTARVHEATLPEACFHRIGLGDNRPWRPDQSGNLSQ